MQESSMQSLIFSIQIWIEENEFSLWKQKTMVEQLFEHAIDNILQNLCKYGKNGI